MYLSKLKNFFINFFINFLCIMICSFFILKEKILFFILLAIALVIYNILLDAFIPFTDNKKQNLELKEKIKIMLINMLYVILYIGILFLSIFLHPLCLMFLGILFSLDVTSLLIRNKRLFFLFFR